MTLVVLMGPIASGKTTYAASLGVPTVSIDAVRVELGYPPGVVAPDLFGVAYRRVERGLRKWPTVVFDSTAVTAIVRQSLRRVAWEAGHATKLVVISTPLEECLRRNARRARPVPVDAVERNFAGFTLALVGAEHEDWGEIIRG